MAKRVKMSTKQAKGVAVAVVIGVLAVSTTGLALALNSAVKQTEVVAMDFKVGTINAEGNPELVDGSVYSKIFSAKGLEVECSENIDVTYVIAWYDRDQGYISSTESMGVNFHKENVPESAEYARIIVTPNDDSDGKISISEKYEYVGQLKILYDRK